VDIERFLDHLKQHAGDRGMMADLRHGLSAATEHRAWPHVAPWCDLRNDRQRQIAVTVAAGFAILGHTVAGDTLGSVLRTLATGDGRGLDGLASFDGRFRRFLSCATAEEVCDHLPGVLRAAERKGVPIDLARLFKDLTFWNDRVKVGWAQDYWGAVAEDAGEDEVDGEDNAGEDEDADGAAEEDGE
jgi:CRISPR type I-E-associated protein CasB/Cse2